MPKNKKQISKLSPPLKWHGGKHYLASWIISHFPPHVHYVEPYAGGAQVLLAKPPEWYEGFSEVISDANVPLMAFWAVVASESRFRALLDTLQAIPFSETEFQECRNRIKNLEKSLRGLSNPEVSEFVAVAADLLVTYRQSRQGLGKSFATLSKTRTRRGMNEQVASWLIAIEGLPEIHARLKRVAIRHGDALKIIQSEDSVDTFFYLDPPYMPETRSESARNAYGELEMSPEDHEKLLELLSRIEGKFLLSGYDSKLYRKFAKANGWKLAQKKIDNKASSAKQKQTKTECLWRNYL